MEEDSSITKLSQKMEDLLARYLDLKSENDMLRNELTSAKAFNEAKDQQINQLEDALKDKDEDIKLKDLEVEDIVGRIDDILNQ